MYALSLSLDVVYSVCLRRQRLDQLAQQLLGRRGCQVPRGAWPPEAVRRLQKELKGIKVQLAK